MGLGTIAPGATASVPTTIGGLRGDSSSSRSARSPCSSSTPFPASTAPGATGVVEGLNGESSLTTREACGLRAFDAVNAALYPGPCSLPEPEFTHGFR
jgi:hypothetical protein